MRVRASADQWALVWFAVLAVAVAGPLLGSGYLLLLDFPSGPRFPALHAFPLPSTGELGNTFPLLFVHAVLKAIHPYLRDKVFLLAPVMLAGIGAYRFARHRLGVRFIPALYGATLFVINPFVRDRYLSGHIHFLLGLSLLPWALCTIHSALRSHPRKPANLIALRIGLWLALLGAVNVHVAGLFGLLVLATAASAPRARLVLLGTASAAAAALSAFWLLPAAFTFPGAAIGAGDLAVYASRPPGFRVLPSLLFLHGFWRQEFQDLSERVSPLYLFFVPVLGLTISGAGRALARREDRRFAFVLASTAALGLVLAAGTSFPPTAPAFRWLFKELPVFAAYREPQKFLALVVLAYSVFGALGLDGLLSTLGPRLGRALAVAALAGVLAYGGGMFWGFGNEVRLSRYPAGWTRAVWAMEERGPGRLLVLPWHLYTVWSFSGGRIVANPAASFFPRDVLVAGEAGFRDLPAQSPDPFRRYVATLLGQRAKLRHFGHLLAPLGVRFLALVREADWETYRFLEDQSDLRLLFENRDISLYENVAWRGLTYELSPGNPLVSPAAVTGSAQELKVTAQLRPAPPLAPREDDWFPPLARFLPGWRSVGPDGSSAFIGTGDRCTDGWRLGKEVPLCHLGAVAAFPSSETPQELWRPLAGVRLTGFTLSALTLIAVGLAVGRYARRAHRRGPGEDR